MDPVSLAGFLGIGLLAGFMAGFLGIGGGVIIIPLLLYGVPALPTATHINMTMQLVTGISIVQAFFATVSGLVVHRRARTVNMRLGLVLGSAGVIGALVGSVGSARISNHILLVLYPFLLLLSLALLFFAPRVEEARSK